MNQVLKLLLLVSIAALMTACKLAVIVVEGGEVQSVGSGTCLEGSICIHQVDDTSYTETFTAVPNSGWVFEKWNSGGGFFCGKSTNPTCTLSLEGTAGNADFEALVASDKTFYIMPIFVQPQQMADAVTVDGKYWLQPLDFARDPYTYDKLSALCPDGVCSGSLPGDTFDLTGYTWASIEEVSALFNAYGVDPPFTGPFQKREEQTVATEFMEDFRSSSDLGVSFVWGIVRDRPPSKDDIYITSVDYFTHSKTGIFYNTYPFPSDIPVGAWFWRPVE
jgi:hypothetical protein